MKKTLIILPFLLILILFFTNIGTATITQSSNSITDGATGISTEVGTFTIQLNSSLGVGQIYVNLSLYQGATLVTSSYLTGKNNGTQSLTIPSLDGNTLYQIRVNANDTDAYNNKTYNFTTATKKLTDDTDNFGTGEIALLGIICIIIIIAVVYSVAHDIKTKKNLNMNGLIAKLVMIIFFVIMITILASLI